MVNGIYFLMYYRRVVYIGESLDCHNRIKQHTDKVFNRFRIIPCNKTMNLSYEKRWIDIFKPKYNKQIGRPIKHAFNSLKLGEKSLLTGSAKKFPHQFKNQFNLSHPDKELIIFRDGCKVYAERIK